MEKKLEYLADYAEKFKERYKIAFNAKRYYYINNFKRILLSIWPYLLLFLVLTELVPKGIPENSKGKTLMALKFLVAIASISLLTVCMETTGAKSEAKGEEIKLSN